MVGKHKPYLRVSDDQKAVTGKHTSKHGIVNAMNPDFPKRKVQYVDGRKPTCWNFSHGRNLKVKSLPCAKMGRPLILGPVLDKQV